MAFPARLEDRLNIMLACMSAEPRQVGVLLLNGTPQRWREIGVPESAYACKLKRIWSTQLVLDGIGMRTGAGTTTAYGLTAEGIALARPLAAFSLWYAVKKNTSLLSLFGHRHTRGRYCGPYHRAQIVSRLEAGPTTPTDLYHDSPLARTGVRLHLRELAAEGIVTQKRGTWRLGPRRRVFLDYVRTVRAFLDGDIDAVWRGQQVVETFDVLKEYIDRGLALYRKVYSPYDRPARRERVYAAVEELSRNGTRPTIVDISSHTGERVPNLRAILRDLKRANTIRAVGENFKHYELNGGTPCLPS